MAESNVVFLTGGRYAHCGIDRGHDNEGKLKKVSKDGLPDVVHMWLGHPYSSVWLAYKRNKASARYNFVRSFLDDAPESTAKMVRFFYD